MATINQIKEAAGAHIASVHGYTIERQLNIQRQGAGYDANDLAQMSVFIDSVRTRSNNLELLSNEELEPFETVLSLYSDITP